MADLTSAKLFIA